MKLIDQPISLKGYTSSFCDIQGCHQAHSSYAVTGQGEESALLKFAEKLRELVRTFEFPHGITMSISIGVTGIRPDDTKKSLLKRVDGLLYQAKSEGRDAVCYIP